MLEQVLEKDESFAELHSGSAGLQDAVINDTDMPKEDDLETYRIVFELFDRDRSGAIDKHDLAAIAVKLGKQPEEGKYHQ
jgi:Ca2+-binding EF-hand superfamily protein